MPAYSFKKRFCPWVADGTKPGTIRSFRKHPVRVGQKAHLYYGLRSKVCLKLIKPEPLICEVSCILITEVGKVVLLETNWIDEDLRDTVQRVGEYTKAGVRWRKLDASEKDRLAWQDGFRHQDKPDKKDGCFELMFRWWKKTHGLPFLGNYILWGKNKV